jgi:serine/threonine protein phosphatase PrpC
MVRFIGSSIYYIMRHIRPLCIRRRVRVCMQSLSNTALRMENIVQEDAHVAVLDLDGKEDAAFFGIFDGHGGPQVARFCAEFMPDVFVSQPAFRQNEIPQALKATYLAIDDKLRLPEHLEDLNRLKAKGNSNPANGSIEAVDQQETVGTFNIFVWISKRARNYRNWFDDLSELTFL